MCNCGNKRNEFTQSLSGNVIAERNIKIWPDVNFEYTGSSGLSVTGGITGKKYRFNHPGDRQLVDYRDASSLMAVPVLKQVKNITTG